MRSVFSIDHSWGLTIRRKEGKVMSNKKVEKIVYIEQRFRELVSETDSNVNWWVISLDDSIKIVDLRDSEKQGQEFDIVGKFEHLTQVRENHSSAVTV